MSRLKDRKSSRIEGAEAAAAAQIMLGRFAGLDAEGRPLVTVSDTETPRPALATARYDLVAEGASVAVTFLNGDPAQPLLLGVISGATATTIPAERVIEATQQLTLRCGRASLTLTRAGKAVLKGTYISSRSSGMQRITGASVQIN